MKRAGDNDGFAVVTAIVILTVMTGLGLGLLLLTDSQQKASGREQAGETAFNVAEAALNAQIGQISRSWPSSATETRCTAETTTETNGCPSKKSLEVGYPNGASSNCPAGAQKDAWGSANTNEWTTYVRDDLGESPVFNSTTESSAATYDANANNKVWVRSVGVVQCRRVVIVALAAAQIVSTTFPQSAISANWFETSNSGNKVIVDTKGKASQAGGVSMRCSGFTGTEKEIEEQCKKWDKVHGQVSPDTTTVSANPSSAFTAAQREALKTQAKQAGTYFAAGTCPNSLEALKGKPTYVEGSAASPCELSFNGGIGNSEKSPGFLVIQYGTLHLNGKAEFFGTVYAVNAQNSSGVVVEVHGEATVTGSIVVDGNGGISFGSSKVNFIYDPTAVNELKTYAGASATRNSFRVLPANQ